MMAYGQEKRRKYREPNRFLHFFITFCKIGILSAILLTTVFFINHFRLSQKFPIKTVQVYGLEHIAEKDVQTVLEPLVNHGFFGIRVEYIRERLLQEPWAADVSVRRLWPDQVEVTVVERIPIARWSDDTLLSDAGILFTPKSGPLPEKLPIFMGPDGQHILMLNYFNEMNRILKPIHAKISYLELTPYLSWKVRLDNGIAIQMGHVDMLARLEHFVAVYPKIVGDYAKDVDSIDLRYSNGVAVKWKAPVET